MTSTKHSLPSVDVVLGRVEGNFNIKKKRRKKKGDELNL